MNYNEALLSDHCHGWVSDMPPASEQTIRKRHGHPIRFRCCSDAPHSLGKAEKMAREKASPPKLDENRRHADDTPIEKHAFNGVGADPIISVLLSKERAFLRSQPLAIDRTDRSILSHSPIQRELRRLSFLFSAMKMSKKRKSVAFEDGQNAPPRPLKLKPLRDVLSRLITQIKKYSVITSISEPETRG